MRGDFTAPVPRAYEIQFWDAHTKYTTAIFLINNVIIKY